jgi:hypothetical protein
MRPPIFAVAGRRPGSKALYHHLKSVTLRLTFADLIALEGARRESGDFASSPSTRFARHSHRVRQTLAQQAREPTGQQMASLPTAYRSAEPAPFTFHRRRMVPVRQGGSRMI